MWRFPQCPLGDRRIWVHPLAPLTGPNCRATNGWERDSYIEPPDGPEPIHRSIDLRQAGLSRPSLLGSRPDVAGSALLTRRSGSTRERARLRSPTFLVIVPRMLGDELSASRWYSRIPHGGWESDGLPFVLDRRIFLPSGELQVVGDAHVQSSMSKGSTFHHRCRPRRTSRTK